MKEKLILDIRLLVPPKDERLCSFFGSFVLVTQIFNPMNKFYAWPHIHY
ncbi:hypothetical protein J2W91_002731 [Paenibacillus amylolyticus]|uniref:Uncharacterized protein n=1 Tax=Paenibacillus amylolyticus TaxID=1451 RepID=A0AAP5LP87_PAEAM|nr:hypothetical protein [Paenibacillus amylolyticus]